MGSGAVEAAASRSGKPLFQDAQDFSTPEQTLLQSFKTQNAHQSNEQSEQQEIPEMIAVEEQKYSHYEPPSQLQSDEFGSSDQEFDCSQRPEISVHEAHASYQRRLAEEKRQKEDAYRMLMEGDLEERSMDQIQV